MPSFLTSVAGLRRRRVVKFHGNRKGVDRKGYRVVNQRLNTTVLQSRTTGHMKTVPNTERVFVGR